MCGPVAQQRRHRRPHHPVDRVDVGRRQECLARAAKLALAHDHVPQAAGHEPHPAQRESHERRGAGGDHHTVLDRPFDRFEQEQRRCGERRDGQRHPARLQLPGRDHARLGEQPHGRVQGREPAGRAEDDPAEVDQAAEVPGAVQSPQTEHDVGGQHHRPGGQQQRHAPGAVRLQEQVHHDRQQQHVAQRIGDGHRLLCRVERRVGEVRFDQEHPGQQPGPGGEDQRVDDGGPVPPSGARPGQTQHPTQEQREHRAERHGVGQGRKRVGMQHFGQHHGDHRADREGERPAGPQPPREPAARPVPHDTVDDGGQRDQDHRDEGCETEVGGQHVTHGEHRCPSGVNPAHPCRHTVHSPPSRHEHTSSHTSRSTRQEPLSRAARQQTRVARSPGSSAARDGR